MFQKGKVWFPLYDLSAKLFLCLVGGESRILMEHTGRYYEVLAHQLSKANLFVSTINPKLIKDFDNDSLRKVKSDKADSIKIARYALDKWQNLKQLLWMNYVISSKP